jgi:hypothetical protein
LKPGSTVDVASMAPSSVYNLMHRHGWRKLAPDKRHPQSDPLAQQE